MNKILLSIIIPTYNRPKLLPRAVNSALAQTIDSFEVIVVDDGSEEPVDLPEHPLLRIVRLPENKGISTARNVGAKAARGHWICHLDDDDELLPNMAQISIEALKNNKLPKPVAAVSGIEVISREGKVIQTCLPPTLPRGSHFGLEKISSSQSFRTKQTLVIEKEVLQSIGGFDESFSSREVTELFLRLNPVCSILGISQITYKLIEHDGFRLSFEPTRRLTDFERLVEKHKQTFQAHPTGFADLIFNQALQSYKLGLQKTAWKNLVLAMNVDLVRTFVLLGSLAKKKLLKF